MKHPFEGDCGAQVVRFLPLQDLLTVARVCKTAFRLAYEELRLRGREEPFLNVPASLLLTDLDRARLSVCRRVSRSPRHLAAEQFAEGRRVFYGGVVRDERMARRYGDAHWRMRQKTILGYLATLYETV